jgi:hypothetical protein
MSDGLSKAAMNSFKLTMMDEFPTRRGPRFVPYVNINSSVGVAVCGVLLAGRT